MKKKKRVFGDKDRPRLVVFRSLNNIYCQIVDDSAQKTIIGASSKSKEIQGDLKKSKGKTEKSRIVGDLIAKKAKDKKIKKIVFDRNGYAYHGRVKALAEGAREGGLKF
ncbi:MAG: 50S ribosomal protein L18 [Desulfobacterales bacterium PC51MH44]|nr:MAG: 50S ribosomal protein L18 [Desulfobacterales bacterium PC51MH44]